jgi:hypothetical protein
LGEQGAERDEQIASVAKQFVEYVEAQTDVRLSTPEGVGADGFADAFATLDAALDQLSDLADVYGADRLRALDPLVLPTAALVGEYLRHGAGARWVEPLFDADTTLVIATQDGVAVDLTGAVRASLLSGVSNLRVMAARLVDPEQP